MNAAESAFPSSTYAVANGSRSSGSAMITASMPRSPGSLEWRMARISQPTTASSASNATASSTTIVRSKRLPMGATT